MFEKKKYTMKENYVADSLFVSGLSKWVVDETDDVYYKEEKTNYKFMFEYNEGFFIEIMSGLEAPVFDNSCVERGIDVDNIIALVDLKPELKGKKLTKEDIISLLSEINSKSFQTPKLKVIMPENKFNPIIKENLTSMVDSSMISIVDDDIDNLKQELETEDSDKLKNVIILFTLSQKTLNYDYIYRLADFVSRYPEKVVTCILLGEGFSEDLETVKRNIKHNGGIVFNSLEEVANFINNYKLSVGEDVKVKRKIRNSTKLAWKRGYPF